MPLRVLVQTAITVVTPPVVFKKFSPTRHTLSAVEPPRDRRRVAILRFRDCTVVVLRRHGGDGGATAVLVRYHDGHGGATAVPRRCHGGATAVPRRSWRCRGDPTADWPNPRWPAEVLNMFKDPAVPPRRSAILTVFRGATAITDGTTAEPRRSWRC